MICQKKLDFIYFEGKTLNCQNINDTYQYNPKYPQEFWDGNLNLCESINGAKYYIWSRNKLDSLNVVKGWFVTVSGLWYYKEKEYLSCLVPVVERYDKKITL